jgi:hypothetical protein
MPFIDASIYERINSTCVLHLRRIARRSFPLLILLSSVKQTIGNHMNLIECR